MRQLLRKVTQVAVIVASSVIILQIILQDYSSFTGYLADADASMLGVGFVFLAASKIVGRYTWKMMMEYLGYPIRFLRAMELISLFQAASYIPGGFWHFVGISYWAEAEDIPKKVTAVGTVINQAAGLVVAALLFFSLAPLYLPLDVFAGYLPVAIGVPVALLALHPAVFYPVLNTGLEFIGREQIEPVLDYSQLVRVFLVNLAAWAIRGVAFYAIIQAFSTVDIALVPGITALYAGSWAVGLLTFVVPGGIGVREVTAISLLSFLIPTALATVFVVVFRVLVLVSEFLFAALFFVLVEDIRNPRDVAVDLRIRG